MIQEGIRDFVISPHAFFEMARRGLDEELICQILKAPDQRYELRTGRVVVQSCVPMGKLEKAYLIRVFVDVERTPAEVVTAYRTSKIEKYWRE